MKPALFIGFGGTGALVLQKTKHAVAKYFHDYKANQLRDPAQKKAALASSVTDTDIPACFQFVEVDIDTDSAAPLGGDKASVLPFDLVAGTEFITSSFAENFLEIETKIQTQTADPDIAAQKKWWPVDLGKTLHGKYKANPNQAFQIRQVGRLALWRNANEIKEKIRASVAALKLTTLAQQVQQLYPNLNLDLQQGIDIFVATSGAGGTGCGMLIDGLALINEAKAANDTVSTFLLLPSCYNEIVRSKEGDVGFRATQTNAYALLKEFDALRKPGGVAYSENFGRVGDLLFGGLSQYTYLITNDLENGENLGGKGVLPAERTAGLVIYLCLGLAGPINAAAGRSARVNQVEESLGWPVAKAYSTFGFSKFSYPQDLLSEYGRHHTTKRLTKIFVDWIGDARRKGHESPITEADWEDCIDKYVQGQTQVPAWFETLIPAYPSKKSPLESSLAEDYIAKSRIKIVQALLDDHSRALEKLDVERGAVRSAQKEILSKIGQTIENQVKSFITMQWYGLAPALLYLETLKNNITTFTGNIQVARETAKENHVKLPGDKQLAKTFEDVANLMQFSSTRSQRVQSLLRILISDIAVQRDYHRNDYYAELITGIAGIVENLYGRLTSLKNAASQVGMRARTVEKHLSNDILIPSAEKGDYFGCSSMDICDFEEPLKEAAQNLLSALYEEVCRNGLIWPEAFVQERIACIVEAVNPDRGFLVRFQEYVRKQKERTGNTTDVFTALVNHVKIASPMIQAPAIAEKPAFYLLAAFTERDLTTAVAGHALTPAGVFFHTLDCVDRNSIVSIAMRDGLTAFDVKEVQELYKVYKKQKGIPRPDRFPSLSAHVLSGAGKWDEIVSDGLPPVTSPARYIRLAEELGMLKKDVKGSWYRFALDGNPAKAPMEKNPNQWKSKTEMADAFNNPEFIQDFRAAAVALLVGKFPNDKIAYASFREEKNKKTGTFAVWLPEEIDNDICRKFNWTF